MRSVIISSFLVASVTYGGCSAFAAQQRIDPGLWSISVQSDALAAVSAIPPEQLDKLRALGVKIPKVTTQGLATQACITPEMASPERALTSAARKMDCSVSNTRFNGNTFSMDLACNNKHVHGSGTLNGTFASEREFTSSGRFKGTVDGVPVDQRASASGKWVGGDCGSVKPLPMSSAN